MTAPDSPNKPKLKTRLLRSVKRIALLTLVMLLFCLAMGVHFAASSYFDFPAVVRSFIGACLVAALALVWTVLEVSDSSMDAMDWFDKVGKTQKNHRESSEKTNVFSVQHWKREWRAGWEEFFAKPNRLWRWLGAALCFISLWGLMWLLEAPEYAAGVWKLLGVLGVLGGCFVMGWWGDSDRYSNSQSKRKYDGMNRKARRAAQRAHKRKARAQRRK